MSDLFVYDKIMNSLAKRVVKNKLINEYQWVNFKKKRVYCLLCNKKLGKQCNYFDNSFRRAMLDHRHHHLKQSKLLMLI